MTEVDPKKELTIHDLYVLIEKTAKEQTDKITNELNEKFLQVGNNVDSIKHDIGILQRKNLTLERNRRKNNIVVFGLTIAHADLVTTVISELRQRIGVELEERDINNIYYIGKNKTNHRAIVVEFVSFLKKLTIFKNVSKLKGTGIAISNDLCREDRETNKVLVKHLKIAKQQQLQARIKGNKLEIDGELYTVEELEKTAERESENSSESESEINTDRTSGGEVNSGPIVRMQEEKTDTLKQQKKKRKRSDKNSPPFLRNYKVKNKH